MGIDRIIDDAYRDVLQGYQRLMQGILLEIDECKRQIAQLQDRIKDLEQNTEPDIVLDDIPRSKTVVKGRVVRERKADVEPIEYDIMHDIDDLPDTGLGAKNESSGDEPSSKG